MSTAGVPKQFVGLFGPTSLFDATLRRLHGRPGVTAPVVVTGSRFVPAAATASLEAGVPIEVVLAEPEGRNTAPACIAAALVSDGDDVLVILPSDHLIRDVDGFAEAVTHGVDLAVRGRIVTFGVTPDGPNTGYGYIEMGPDHEGARVVERFKEKPDEDEARRLVADGSHVWNSGMFVVKASVLVEEAGIHCPEILAAVGSSLRPPEQGIIHLGEEFGSATRISLDHAIMEKTDRAVVIPIDVGWDDVGSFQALWSISDKDDSGNVVAGDVTLVDVAGSYIRSTSRTVAVAGLDDVVVVETEDSVLVVAREKAQLVKDLVERLGPG